MRDKEKNKKHKNKKKSAKQDKLEISKHHSDIERHFNMEDRFLIFFGSPKKN